MPSDGDRFPWEALLPGMRSVGWTVVALVLLANFMHLTLGRGDADSAQGSDTGAVVFAIWSTALLVVGTLLLVAAALRDTLKR